MRVSKLFGATMTPTDLPISEVLKKWRVMRELTLKDASAMIGIGPSVLQYLEAGRPPSAETQVQLIRWLFERRGQNGTGPEKV